MPAGGISDHVVKNPELIFGIVGPIGVDIDSVVAQLEKSLSSVKYSSKTVHLTKLISDERVNCVIDDSSYFRRYESLIEYGNEFRKMAADDSAMAGVAIAKIREYRAQSTGSADTPALGNSFIVRQFKRPEEVALMRRIYGRKFILISIFGSPIERRKNIVQKIRTFDASPKNDADCETQAIKLIDMDHNQKDNKNGQRLSEVFHLGDVFVNGSQKKQAAETIDRFIRALFGENKASPTKDEYGLYTAAAASLRSVDLSRQVGAAIFTKNGEILSLGCNEVPKAHGGTYWSDEDGDDARDVEIGSDPNQDRKNEILFDLVVRLAEEGFLSQRLTSVNDPHAQVAMILENQRFKEAQIMDIIEFGRIIHAEMSAISDAARLGHATKGSVLFCTTFPCHLCAKHIVAAGIDRVVFLEPYPKSYAEKQHSDSITFDKADEEKVLFEPFIGISPRRYRDIFEKKKRKDALGKAREWYEGEPTPLIEDKSPAYIEGEVPAIFISLRKMYTPGGGAEN